MGVKLEFKVTGLKELQKKLNNISKIVKKYDDDEATISVETAPSVEQYHVSAFTTPAESVAAQNNITEQIVKELDNA